MLLASAAVKLDGLGEIQPKGLGDKKLEELEMISDTMEKELNKQINAEMYSAYLYLSMSSEASFKGLSGMAHWFYVQAQEEMTHAQKIYNYLNSRGGRVLLETIDQPPTEFGSLMQTFEAVLDHEKKVTAMINNLVDLAAEAKDHATAIFLQWFVTEQVEEEESASDVIAKLKLLAEAAGGLLMLDKELGTRIFTPPAGFKTP